MGVGTIGVHGQVVALHAEGGSEKEQENVTTLILHTEEITAKGTILSQNRAIHNHAVVNIIHVSILLKY